MRDSWDYNANIHEEATPACRQAGVDNQKKLRLSAKLLAVCIYGKKIIFF